MLREMSRCGCYTLYLSAYDLYWIMRGKTKLKKLLLFLNKALVKKEELLDSNNHLTRVAIFYPQLVHSSLLHRKRSNIYFTILSSAHKRSESSL